ncbi:MAG TPA: DUF3817 domain-containing protein [Sphingobacteriaceae bacterium]
MIKELSKTALGRFRIIAFLEGCSYLLLGLTMILKYQFEMPGPNYVVGMAHGILFILYVFLLLQVAYSQKWVFGKAVMAFAASLVPFGTFYADKKIFAASLPKK